jgi:hypothetical protein
MMRKKKKTRKKTDLNIESVLRKRGNWWLTSHVDEYLLRLTLTYFQLKYRLPRVRRQFEKGVYDRLLREFALAARVDITEGSKNAVYLHAVLKLSENDFKNAMREYTIRTKDLDLGRSFSIFVGKDGPPILFGSYIEWLRERRELERYLMELGKHVEESQNKQFEREREEKSINSIIEICKKAGWDWLGKAQRKADE